MRKVTYYSRLGEAICEECGAAFAASDFESAKEHDENPCSADMDDNPEFLIDLEGQSND